MVMLLLFTVTLVAGTFTVTTQVALTPLVVVTVMVAVPFPTAVTTPSLDTVATSLLEVLQVKVSVVSAGFIVAVKL